MVTLSNGRCVLRSRIQVGGDLHEHLGEDLKVVNVWRKFDMPMQGGLPKQFDPEEEEYERRRQQYQGEK